MMIIDLAVSMLKAVYICVNILKPVNDKCQLSQYIASHD